jgi:hypothetical protein
MTDRDREGLIARFRQLRRPVPVRNLRATTADPSSESLRSLERRVAHFEEMVEGLQDSVHRESERQARLISELQDHIAPGAMAAALAADARNRGL